MFRDASHAIKTVARKRLLTHMHHRVSRWTAFLFMIRRRSVNSLNPEQEPLKPVVLEAHRSNECCVHTEPKTSSHCPWKFDGEKILSDFQKYVDELSLCMSWFCVGATFALHFFWWQEVKFFRIGLGFHPTWGQPSLRGHAGASPCVSSLCLRVCALWALGLERGLCLSKEHTLPLFRRSLVFICSWITLRVIFKLLATAASKLC